MYFSSGKIRDKFEFNLIVWLKFDQTAKVKNTIWYNIIFNDKSTYIL